MKINFFKLIAISFVLTSCTSYKYTSRLARISTDNTYMIPNVVDVKIDFTKKITSRSNKHSNLNSAKEEAYFKVINENNVDVLVSPIYELETTSKFLFFGGNSKAMVTGYAGYFINPRTVQVEQDKNYDVKLEALEKMLKLEPLAKEQQKVVMLTTTSNIDNKGKSTTEKEVLFKSPSILENFNNLYYGNTVSPENSDINLQSQNNPAQSLIDSKNKSMESNDEQPKKKLWKKLLPIVAVLIFIPLLL